MMNQHEIETLLTKEQQNELQNLRTERAELSERADAIANEGLELKKQAAIFTALMAHNFHDYEEVAALTAKMIEPDACGTFVGIDPEGNKLPLSEFYRRYAWEHPYLVKGSVAASTKTTKASLRNAKDKAEFITRYGLDAWEHLPLR